MVRDLALADQVFGAGDLIGKNRRDQILGGHARELRWYFLSTAKARQGERHPRDPPPAGNEHRRIEQRLDQQISDAGRMQVAGYLREIEAVRLRQRQNDVVLGRRRLELEIEFPAKALAQRQPPRPVEAAAVRRVDHQLGATSFIKEALDDERVLGRQNAERGVTRGQVFDKLLGGGFGDTDLILEV